jgi:DsbC/DsbD-like thiol-disulfide interchange protein
MRRLGLINERVREDHAAYGIAAQPRHEGLPYPGVFVLDEAGIITQRRFHESYRERDTGRGLIADVLGIVDRAADAEATAGDDAVGLHAWLDSPTYGFFQRLSLTVELRVAPGFHVYGDPAPQGLVPVSVEIAPMEGVDVGAMRWPAPRELRTGGVEDALWVHDGTIRGVLPLTFSGASGAGDRIVRARVRYQACNASLCLPPTSVSLEVSVKEVALIGRPIPPKA